MLCKNLGELYDKLSGDGVWINTELSYGENFQGYNKCYKKSEKKYLLLPTAFSIKSQRTELGYEWVILDSDRWEKSTMPVKGIGLSGEWEIKTFDDYVRYLKSKGKVDTSGRTPAKTYKYGDISVEFQGYTEEEIYTVHGAREPSWIGTFQREPGGPFWNARTKIAIILGYVTALKAKIKTVIFTKSHLTGLDVKNIGGQFSYKQEKHGLLYINFPGLVGEEISGMLEVSGIARQIKLKKIVI